MRPGTTSGLSDDSRGCLSEWVGDGGRGTGRVQLTNVLEGSLNFEKAVGGRYLRSRIERIWFDQHFRSK